VVRRAKCSLVDYGAIPATAAGPFPLVLAAPSPGELIPGSGEARIGSCRVIDQNPADGVLRESLSNHFGEEPFEKPGQAGLSSIRPPVCGTRRIHPDQDLCTEAVPGGDSACGFANTAMQLAHQQMLPEVLAAVVRAMSAVRSLAAFEEGAVGPSKDCAYEGPIVKAITGVPISMEGKSASCAHFSPVGNIAAAMCDLWSNESVQNVRLLAGNAPEVFTESLIYDCRLMNVASSRGAEPFVGFGEPVAHGPGDPDGRFRREDRSLRAPLSARRTTTDAPWRPGRRQSRLCANEPGRFRRGNCNGWTALNVS